MLIRNSANGRATHLSYCTNIHAGNSWDEAFTTLRENVPVVRDACTSHVTGEPFGVGLRLSRQHVDALQEAPRLEAFLSWLTAENLYVFTINGFPYGAFHGKTVKADVYRPDWTQPERLAYTCDLVSLAARLSAPGQHISISTLPGTYKSWASGAEPAIAEHLLECVAHCMQVEQDTGVHVAIAIEPEPCCMLETADEVVDFFSRCLQSDAALRQLASSARSSSVSEARAGLSRHLGVCHDVCHSAVEFEPALLAVDHYAAAGIPVFKIQLSSALKLAPADADARAALAAFDEPVYLHQVVRRNSRDELQRYTDITEALKADADLEAEWRVHFHVPVFLDVMEEFGTTQSILAELLDRQASQPVSPHLEIETYTWDVLPEAYRGIPVTEAIARELDWVHARLEQSSPA